jgi:MoaA/NifB/PqqE/SkfB family radical SAM enzyme
MPQDANIPEMPFLRNIGLLMTYKCQVACPHCVIEAGPHRTEAVSLGEALDWVDQIARYRDGYIRVLSLTGGEPFFDLGLLRTLSEHATARGLLVSAVTNAFWAHSEASAVDVLQSLPGIRMVAVSCDVYHQLMIPFERVENAIRAARACDVAYNVAVCTQNTDEPEYQALLRQLLEVTEPDSINTAITLPVGRARTSLLSAGYRMSPEAPATACAAGGTPIIFPRGRMVACIGPIIDLKHEHPLVLGSLQEEPLEAILDRAEENVVLHAMRIWGPRRLISLLREAGHADSLPSAYIEGSICDACYALLSRPEIIDSLAAVTRGEAFAGKVMYARSYHLKEVSPRLLSELAGQPS